MGQEGVLSAAVCADQDEDKHTGPLTGSASLVSTVDQKYAENYSTKFQKAKLGFATCQLTTCIALTLC